MGGCASRLRKAIEAEDRGEKPEPAVEAEEDKKAAAETEEQFEERVKAIVGEDENENEIAVGDEIQGSKQRPSLSLLFKQEAAKELTESEKLKNEKQEPILEAQEQDPTRPKEEAEQQHHELGKIQGQQEAETPSFPEQTKSEDVA